MTSVTNLTRKSRCLGSAGGETRAFTYGESNTSQIPRSQAEDVERAIDAAHAAAGAWGRTAVAERARTLNRIADRMEQYLPFLAAVETHKMMLDHYQQTKNVPVSYGTKALGFF